MKRLLCLVTMFLYVTFNMSAQEWVGVDKSAPSRIQESLVSSTEEEIVVDVKVGGFFQNAATTPRG